MPVSKPVASTAKEIGNLVREAVESGGGNKKGMTLTLNGKDGKPVAMPDPVAPGIKPPAAPALRIPPGVIPNPMASRQALQAKAAAMAGHGAGEVAGALAIGELDWNYQGPHGPTAWGRFKPEFNLCTIGKRQSPINIETSATLQGPAEPILFSYPPGGASVFNSGRTIQVDVAGDSTMTVRGSTFKLLQFHFHHPSEERVNSQGFAMVAHLVHRNAEGQLAVVAVLLEPGAPNPLIHKVWTYMPLDTGDRVRMPADSLDLAALLPKDQRYYQFIGSLTTPPCSEGVLWLVLKQPMTLSHEQLRLFAQLFPNNTRPVQPVHGRAVRDAQ